MMRLAISAALTIDAKIDRNNEQVPLLATSRSPDSICDALFAVPDTIAVSLLFQYSPQI